VQFADVARDVGLDFVHFAGTRSTQLPEDMGSGAAWGDFDNDGDDDLFVVNVSGPLAPEGSPGSVREPPRRASSRLFRNDSGRFTDVTGPAGLERDLCGMAAAWGDADGDGWLDLVVTTFGRVHLFRNNGDGTFADRSGASGLLALQGFWTGASWADYDRDGDADLYICGYVRYRYEADAAGRHSTQFEAEVPFALNPSSYAPERNLLLRNDGRGRFTDVAPRAGVDNPSGRSLSAAWADFDDDGWVDLYVANDVSDNAMFRNLGNGRFADISHEAWVADPRGAMGLAVGDWDLDGDFDLFVTHWLAQVNALFTNMRIGAPGAAPGRMVFMDAADQFGLGQASLDFIKWGTAFFDYDNDGRPDLLSVNGSTFQDPANPTRLLPMPHQLYWNRGDRDGFYDVSAIAGDALSAPSVGRGAALADFDRDGDLDIALVSHGGPLRLLRNEGGNRQHWLQVRVTVPKGRTPVGAVVSVTASGRTQRQQVGSQPSYLSQHSQIVHFGLGTAMAADVEVALPGRRVVRRTAVPANRLIDIVGAGS
jgi:hypothetical protein